MKSGIKTKQTLGLEYCQAKKHTMHLLSCQQRKKERFTQQQNLVLFNSHHFTSNANAKKTTNIHVVVLQNACIYHAARYHIQNSNQQTDHNVNANSIN